MTTFQQESTAEEIQRLGAEYRQDSVPPPNSFEGLHFTSRALFGHTRDSYNSGLYLAQLVRGREHLIYYGYDVTNSLAEHL